MREGWELAVLRGFRSHPRTPAVGFTIEPMTIQRMEHVGIVELAEQIG